MRRLLILLVFAVLFSSFSYGNEDYKDYKNVGKKVKQVFDELQFNEAQTKVRLITDNVEAWFARWYVMNNAKKTIDTTYFILANDIYGKSFLGLLLKKIKQGVKVRLMIDARGSGYFSRNLKGGQDYLQELVEAGAEVKVFSPMHRNLPKLPFKLKYFIASNHDKMIIADKKMVIAGGRNIQDVYFMDPSDNDHVYRDTDVIMEGKELANSIQLAFDEEFERSKNFIIKKELLGNWYSKAYDLLLAEKAMQRWILGLGSYRKTDGIKKNPSIYNEELMKSKKSQWFASYKPFYGERAYPMKILDKHSIAGTRDDISDSIVKFIDNCEKELLIQNPYVVLTKKAKAALQRANDRGVKIILHTNSPVSTDNIWTQAFFIDEWKDFLAKMKNFEIWAYVKKKSLHSKVFVFDRKVAIVGSYNFDEMSENINSEVITLIKSDSFAMRTALKIYKDMEESKQYKIEMGRDGEEPVELFGPAALAKGKLKVILEVLGSMKFLRPLM